MNEETVETVEVTHVLLQTLLNLTSEGVELQTPKLRHLVRALHNVKFSRDVGRWVLTLTRKDIEAVDTIIRADGLINPGHELRFERQMIKQSQMYQELLADSRRVSTQEKENETP